MCVLGKHWYSLPTPCEFKARLVYRASSRTAKAPQSPASINKQIKGKIVSEENWKKNEAECRDLGGYMLIKKF